MCPQTAHNRSVVGILFVQGTNPWTFKDHLKTWWNRVLDGFLNDSSLTAEVHASTAACCGFAAMAKCMVTPTRHFLVAALLLIVLPTWLIADIWSLDGLVPGAKNSYDTQAQPFTERRDPIISWHQHPTGNVSYSCLCSFNSSKAGAMMWGAPYAMLQVAVRQQEVDVGQILGYNNQTTVPPILKISKEDNITADLALRFIVQIGQAVVSTPVTSALLTKPAWQMARLSEAKRKF